MSVKQWQTRSETNGIRFHKSKDAAFRASWKDNTIWKISGEGHRYIRQPDGTWQDEPMDKIIKETVQAYKNLMSDPVKRDEFENELLLWDETVGDGIDSE